MRSFNKLSADTVLCAHNKNMRFVRHVGSFVKMSSSAVELQLAPSSCKSKVWKDFGFKVFYDGQGVYKTLLVIFLCYLLPFVSRSTSMASLRIQQYISIVVTWPTKIWYGFPPKFLSA